jgi:hypothetical protein
MSKVVVTTRIVRSTVRSIRLTKLKFTNEHATSTPFLRQSENLLVAVVVSAAMWATLAWIVTPG